MEYLGGGPLMIATADGPSEKIDIGIFDFDANRKTLRDAHPVYSRFSKAHRG